MACSSHEVKTMCMQKHQALEVGNAHTVRVCMRERAHSRLIYFLLFLLYLLGFCHVSLVFGNCCCSVYCLCCWRHSWPTFCAIAMCVVRTREERKRARNYHWQQQMVRQQAKYNKMYASCLFSWSNRFRFVCIFWCKACGVRNIIVELWSNVRMNYHHIQDLFHIFHSNQWPLSEITCRTE